MSRSMHVHMIVLACAHTHIYLIEDSHEPGVHGQQVQRLSGDVEQGLHQLLSRRLAVHVAEFLLFSGRNTPEKVQQGCRNENENMPKSRKGTIGV